MAGFYNENGRDIEDGVTSINGLTGDITLSPGTNITLDTVGNDITINATGGGVGSNPITGEIVAGGPTTWTLANVPVDSIELIANGQVLLLTEDYTIVGDTVTTLASWTPGTVQATYHF